MSLLTPLHDRSSNPKKINDPKKIKELYITTKWFILYFFHLFLVGTEIGFWLYTDKSFKEKILDF